METRKIKITTEQWQRTCPECNKLIVGVNKKQLDWNFDVHHQSCKNKKKKGVDEKWK